MFDPLSIDKVIVGDYVFIPAESMNCGKVFVGKVLEMDALTVRIEGISWLGRLPLLEAKARLATKEEIVLYGT